jgi:hypothetical protein
VLDILFTLDYEIHGNGHGSPRALMVDPTSRMLRQFDRYGAKLTVMADIAEILRFRRHAEESGTDDFDSGLIEAQLQDAVRGGHDVQLHVHPSYFNAEYEGGSWQLDYSEYDLAGLPLERINEIVRTGKAYLEDLLRPVDASYACVASRSANWSAQPSPNLVRALLANGVPIDTSVFKHGRRNGLVQFDYRHAHSELVPWRVDVRDICRADPEGELLEVPIYSENRHIHHFLSLNRIYRAFQTRLHPVPSEPAVGGAGSRPEPRDSGRVGRVLNRLRARHAWKLDFNQCSGRQLIAGLERAARNHDRGDRALPVVLIGHSKLFTRLNERQLDPFLAHVARNPDRFRFATFRESLPRIA